MFSFCIRIELSSNAKDGRSPSRLFDIDSDPLGAGYCHHGAGTTMRQAENRVVRSGRVKLRFTVWAIREPKFMRVRRQMCGQATPHQYAPKQKLFCPLRTPIGLIAMQFIGR